MQHCSVTCTYSGLAAVNPMYLVRHFGSRATTKYWDVTILQFAVSHILSGWHSCICQQLWDLHLGAKSTVGRYCTDNLR